MATNSSIIGGWYVKDDSESVFTLLADGTYYVADKYLDPFTSRYSGAIEYGTYSFNSGNISLTTLVDTSPEPEFRKGEIISISTTGDKLNLTSLTNGGSLQATSVTSATNPIVGSWYRTDESGSVITFLADGTYFMADNRKSTPDGQAGMEYGTYSWDSKSGQFSAKTSVDTTGEWGFSHVPFPVSVTISGDTINFAGGEVTATRVGTQTTSAASTQPVVTTPAVDYTNTAIVGSWEGDGVVANFLANGTFFLAKDGIEYGTYSWNQTNGSFSANLLMDTNGAAGGFSSNLLKGGSNISFKNGAMTFTQSGSAAMVLERVENQAATSTGTNTVAKFSYGIDLSIDSVYLPYARELQTSTPSSLFKTIDADGSTTNYYGNFIRSSNSAIATGSKIIAFDGSDSKGNVYFSFASSKGFDAFQLNQAVQTNNKVNFFNILLSGNDSLIGSAQDDVLGGYGGNDTIDGGLGKDKVFFSGNSADYKITLDSNASNFTTVQNIKTSEVDRLTNVELLQFVETTISVPTFSANFLKSATVNIVKNGVTVTFSSAFDMFSANSSSSGANSFSTIFSGNDVINGSFGNDILSGFGGNDTIYGGGGVDTVFFSGNYSDYKITSVSGVVTVTHIQTNETDVSFSFT